MLNKIKENKALKITIATVKTLLTIFLLMLIGIIFIQRVTNNNFAIGGIRVFTIITGSMIPEYEIGDMIISIETQPEKIEVGDNVVYKGLVNDFNGKIITHKVISKEKNNNEYEFITKGVNNSLEDPKIKSDQIIGKVVYKTVILSFISKLINNTTAFFFVVFIPFVVLVFFEILGICGDRKEEDEE